MIRFQKEAEDLLGEIEWQGLSTEVIAKFLANFSEAIENAVIEEINQYHSQGLLRAQQQTSQETSVFNKMRERCKANTETGQN